MYIALTVKYAGPTERRGSRMLVSGEGRRLAVPYRHDLDDQARILDAAGVFLCRFGMRGSPGAVATTKPGEYVVIVTPPGR